MAIANISGNILTDSGVATSSLVSGSGTTNYVSKFTASGVLGNSLIFDNGTNVGIGTASPSDKFSVDAGTGNIVTSSFFNSTMTAGQSTFLEFGKNYANNYNTGELAFKFVGDGSSSNMVSIGFYGAGNKLNVLGNGNVGIGTSSPSAKLHISGTAANTVCFLSDTTGYALYQIGNTGGGLYYGIDSSTASGFANGAYSRHIYSTGAYPLIISTNDTERMRITSDGNLLLGTTDNGSGAKLVFFSTTAAQQLKAAGTAPAITFSNTITSPTIGGSLGACTSAGQFLSGTAAGDMILINQFTGNKLYITNYSGGVYLTQGATSWTANSDIRLKNINSHIENAVEKLSTLQAINFSYKDDKFNKQNLGLIAQEVEKIFPELIDKNGDGMLGVRYTELVPVLIKAVQELKAEIETLKNK